MPPAGPARIPGSRSAGARGSRSVGAPAPAPRKHPRTGRRELAAGVLRRVGPVRPRVSLRGGRRGTTDPCRTGSPGGRCARGRTGKAPLVTSSQYPATFGNQLLVKHLR
ncbi:hypothetical protein Snoj_27290 [Streptomyces nojiriensis]|uniref:Uncharacterized protein n=1 Tax=Streptomyces nojiriensis TaxID=66374 RepID=A0ABQ3SKZ6_9ACTN|nr:hypothetical protein GCM10010205_73370 [Streptomyces nojiriensis]GHI68811.1 hypothetical protein Snoj_27290 [Streptomyces nojiriensis]